MSDPESARQGIQSVEVAGPLLRALSAAAGALPLTQLAREAGMPAAKAHRYLVSLIRVGLVSQDAASGGYDLGPLALELGMAALGRIDALKLAEEAMEALRNATGETVALAVWGNHGPTYVRLKQSRRPVTVNLQVGSVMPMTYTASGLCFAAWLPQDETRDLLKQELAHNRNARLDAPRTMAALAPLLEEVRRHGMARMVGRLDPAEVSKGGKGTKDRAAGLLLAGFNAFSAPVFDHEGKMCFALTVVGSSAHVGEAWSGDISRATQAAAAALSQRLGWRRV